MTPIIDSRNKQEEKVVRDAALGNAMQKGRKTALLSKTEKANFLRRLKQAEVFHKSMFELINRVIRFISCSVHFCFMMVQNKFPSIELHVYIKLEHFYMI